MKHFFPMVAALIFCLSLASCHSAKKTGVADGGKNKVKKKIDLENGLVSWWKLEDNAADSIGKSNGKAKNVVFSKEGNAKFAVFNGKDSYIRVNPLTSFAGKQKITVSASIKINGDLAKSGAVIIGHSGYNEGWRFVLGELDPVRKNVLGFQIGTEKGTKSIWYYKKSLKKDKWYNVLALVDGRCIKLFVDGKWAESTLFSGEFIVPSYWLGIGYNNKGVGYFNGNIRDVRIWNRALSRSEIKTLGD